MIKEGIRAPDFTLPDKDGNAVTLSAFAGRKVVLYFYPKDSTPGCTRQAQAFAKLYEKLKETGAEIIGISKDSADSHRKFAGKYALPFILLSDPEKKAIEAYGTLKQKSMYGKIVTAVARTTYIIDENGMIEKAMENVNPDTNAAEILDYLTNA